MPKQNTMSRELLQCMSPWLFIKPSNQSLSNKDRIHSLYTILAECGYADDPGTYLNPGGGEYDRVMDDISCIDIELTENEMLGLLYQQANHIPTKGYDY